MKYLGQGDAQAMHVFAFLDFCSSTDALLCAVKVRDEHGDRLYTEYFNDIFVPAGAHYRHFLTFTVKTDLDYFVEWVFA